MRLDCLPSNLLSSITFARNCFLMFRRSAFVFSFWCCCYFRFTPVYSQDSLSNSGNCNVIAQGSNITINGDPCATRSSSLTFPDVVKAVIGEWLIDLPAGDAILADAQFIPDPYGSTAAGYAVLLTQLHVERWVDFDKLTGLANGVTYNYLEYDTPAKCESGLFAMAHSIAAHLNIPLLHYYHNLSLNTDLRAHSLLDRDKERNEEWFVDFYKFDSGDYHASLSLDRSDQ
jgi:hypothetical protein